MQVSFSCPGCQQTSHVEVAAGATAIGCARCAWSRAISADDLQGGRPDRCLVCGCGDLWRQKDFPQKLGLGMVGLGALLSTIAWTLYMPLTAIGVLLGFAFVDLLLYTFMPDVLVCYRCAARHRHAMLDAEHPRFNLETAERYRQEAARQALSLLSPPQVKGGRG
jgi:hypothetical protein